MRLYPFAFLAPLLLATVPKTWAPGEVLRATDLNAMATYFEGALKGAGHTLIVNADISSSAAIAHSKLATPALVPKAFAQCARRTTDGANTCTSKSGVTSVTRNTTGDLDVVLNYTPADTNFLVVVTAEDTGGNNVFCQTSIRATTGVHFSILCHSDGATPGALADSGISFIVMDDN